MPQLTIPEDVYERLVRRAAALNVTVEQLVVPALEALEGAASAPVVEGDRVPRPSGDLSDDEWRERFDELLALTRSRAERYSPGFQADVRRESIYEGCGE